MPYRNMSIDELARHIGMDARIVRKWAEKGRLPGVMVQGQWRFNRAQMLDWLQQEIHNLDPKHIANLERAMSGGNDDEVLGALLPPEAIDMNLPARSRASVLKELVSLAERTGLVYDPLGLLTAVQEREELYPTALPNGVALPHPRRPLPYATAEPLVCLARVPAGIPFGAPDGQLTHVFFLVCSHEERQHLCVLARLAMMLSTDLPARLLEIDEPTEALALILEREQQVIARR
ncbi:MAG: PTS transporter subunit EIIA [Phycisphaerae bacterium]|jgi:PTS system nitrogen regulatory IIA component|nr:PTS transporter subunit EIIA [Phycisphaerae bacterium]